MRADTVHTSRTVTGQTVYFCHIFKSNAHTTQRTTENVRVSLRATLTASRGNGAGDAVGDAGEDRRDGGARHSGRHGSKYRRDGLCKMDRQDTIGGDMQGRNVPAGAPHAEDSIAAARTNAVNLEVKPGMTVTVELTGAATAV